LCDCRAHEISALLAYTAYSIKTFEEQLRQGGDRAFLEISRYFERRGPLHETVRRFDGSCRKLGIAYALAGDLAMFFHGLR
jgi:hypothetical protein